MILKLKPTAARAKEVSFLTPARPKMHNKNNALTTHTLRSQYTVVATLTTSLVLCFTLPSFPSIPRITLSKMSTSTLLAESTNKRKSNEDLEGAAAGKKTTTDPTPTKSPHDTYMEKMTAFMTEKDYMGSLLVKGIRRDPQADSDDEEEDDQQDSDNITEE
jgi:hypothetical protein